MTNGAGRADYLVPRTRAELMTILPQIGEDAVIVAGGQTIVPQIARWPRRWRTIVDLRHLEGSGGIEIGESEIVIGAMATLTNVIAALAGSLPVIARALAKSGNQVIRNRATVGGSVAIADPGSELVAGLASYDAQMIVLTREGESRRPLAGPAPGMVIASIAVRRPSSDERAGFAEYVRRPSGGRALAMAFSRDRCDDAIELTLAGPIEPRRLRMPAMNYESALATAIATIDVAPPHRAWLFAAAKKAIGEMQ